MEFKFPNHWKCVEAQDFCERIADGTHDSPKEVAFGKKLVTSKNIVGGVLNLDRAYFISEKDFEQINKRSKVDRFDILLSMIGTVGQVCLIEIDPDFAIKNVGLLKNKNEKRAKWLFYYLTSLPAQHAIARRLRGTTQQYLTLGEIRKFPIYYPPLKEMDRIVEIMDAFRYKIELNNQINDTLEAMAQAIFKSWFVDFDPVHAKAKAKADGLDEEGINRAAMAVIASKSDAELAKMKADSPAEYEQLKTLASLFPAQLEESELGLIPQGWEVSSLSDLIIITGGGTPKRSEPSYWNGDIPWFSIKDLPKKNVFVINTEEKITEAGLKKSSTKLLEKGTTIITARGTVGELALLAIDSCMNQSCYGIRGKDFGDFFNYFNLKQAVHTLKQNVHGAVFDTITTKTFDTYHLPYSGSNLAIAYEDFVTPLMLKVINNNYQNQTLTELRDALLPKLLSGEIEV